MKIAEFLSPQAVVSDLSATKDPVETAAEAQSSVVRRTAG